MYTQGLTLLLSAFAVLSYGQLQQSLIGHVVPARNKVEPSEWAALNISVEGRLYAGRPLGFPCYTSYNGTSKIPDTAACAEIMKEQTYGTFVATKYGGYQQSNWGVCQESNQGCAVPIGDVNWPPYINGDCAQGNVPEYYIDMLNISDATAGLAFATNHKIPVVIKNSGHDYMGRSAAPHSLALWTYKYKPEITLMKEFLAEGCTEPIANVVTFGAGEAWEGIYQFAEIHNITVPGGSSETVGAAGGWITGGGHSALSPIFGLGVDSVQQFRVVLPNGTYVVANRCRNQDIFFACRGGGGGTFGVVTEMSTLAFPKLSFQFVSFPFGSLKPVEQHQLVEVLVSHANKWARQGWGGYGNPVGPWPSNGMEFMNPLLSAIEAKESLKPLVDFASSLGYEAIFTTYSSWYPLYREHIFGGLGNRSSIGGTIASRLIPAWEFDGMENQTRLTETLFQTTNNSAGIPVMLMVLMVTPWRTANTGTSVTHAWRDATWHVVTSTVWDPTKVAAGDTEERFKVVHESMRQLRDLTPGGGAYLNEADTFEPDPQMSFWGHNYARLLDIKNELDPYNLMQVHQGVGWNPDSEVFACYPKSPNR